MKMSDRPRATSEADNLINVLSPAGLAYVEHVALHLPPSLSLSLPICLARRTGIIVYVRFSVGGEKNEKKKKKRRVLLRIQILGEISFADSSFNFATLSDGVCDRVGATIEFRR